MPFVPGDAAGIEEEGDTAFKSGILGRDAADAGSGDGGALYR